MKHFFDKLNSMTKQSFSAAAIVDAKGNHVGRVLIRFTDSYIGWNHEAGVIFHAENVALNMNSTRKGNTYSTPGTLYYLFRDAGVKCYDRRDQQIGDYDNKTAVNYDSLSRFDDIASVKISRKIYKLLWIL